MFIQFAILSLSLLIASHIVTGNGCDPKFPKECICGRESYEGVTQYIVNCTNAGLNDTSLLVNMPEETQILIFTGNKINELPWNVFGEINDYLDLTIVDMSNNGIQEIRGKAYHHVQNVRRLILNHNNLTISPDLNHHHPRVFSNFINLEALHLTDAFADNSSPRLSEDLHDIFVNSNLTKLQKLHLEQNEISHFKDRKVFCDLPSLRDLHLGDNNLKEINFEVKCLKHLRFLDLERNKFEFIKSRDLSTLDELEERKDRTTKLIIDFNLNPFVCDCKLIPFRQWIGETKLIVRSKENLMCYRDKIIAESIVEYEQDNCGYGGSGLSRHTFTLIFLLVVLCVTLICLIAALAYVSRDKIKHIITPVFDTVSKKVHYTTIRDEECPEVQV